jgi:hypothetical protein
LVPDVRLPSGSHQNPLGQGEQPADNNNRATSAQVRFGSNNLFNTFPFGGLFLKPSNFFPKSIKKPRQVRLPVCLTPPAQPLKADDFQKIKASLQAGHFNSPSPSKVTQTKRKREKSGLHPFDPPTESDPTVRKPIRTARIDKYFAKTAGPANDTPWPFMDINSPLNPWSVKYQPNLAGSATVVLSTNLQATCNTVITAFSSVHDTTLTTTLLVNSNLSTPRVSHKIHQNNPVKVTSNNNNTINNIVIPSYLDKTPTNLPPSDLSSLLGSKYDEAIQAYKPKTNSKPTVSKPRVQAPPLALPSTPILDTTNLEYMDLPTLLGPKFSKFTAKPPSQTTNKIVTFNTPTPEMKNKKSTLLVPLPTTPLDPKTQLGPSGSKAAHNDKDNYLSLDQILGPKYSSYTQSQPNQVTVNTNVLNAPTNQSDFLLSLQNNIKILDEAMIPWRQARSFLAGQAKSECRAQFLDNLRTSGVIPPWALGLEPVPGYLEREMTDLIELRRHQAVEVLALARDLMNGRARNYSSTGRAALMTCEILYRYEEQEDWEAARGLLAQLIGSDKQKCQIALNKRAEYLSNHPVSDETITKQLLDGPKAASGSNNSTRRRSRSRSRSPLKNNVQGTRQNRSRNPRQQPPRDNKTNPRSNSRGEQPNRPKKDNKGRAKNSQSRSYNGANRSSGASTSTSNTRPNSSYDNPSIPRRVRAVLELTETEKDLVRSLLNKDNGQQK